MAYSNLISLQPKSSRLLSMYAGFLSDVNNDIVEGKKLSLRAEAFNSSNLDSGNGMSGNGHLLQQKPIIVFDITGENIGKIQYANNDAAVLLNEVSFKLLERNALEILVPPFSSHLSVIIKRFFQEGRSPFFRKRIDSFVFTSNRTCIQVSLRLAPYTADGFDFSLFASLVPVEKIANDSENNSSNRDDLWSGYLLCMHKTGVILAPSQKGHLLLQRITTLFSGVDHGSHIASGTTIRDIIHDYDNLHESATRGEVKFKLGYLKPEWVKRIESAR